MSRSPPPADKRRQIWGILSSALAILLVAYAYHQHTETRDRITTLEILLKGSLFDAAAAACNTEAAKEERDERFSRPTSYAQAHFKLWRVPGSQAVLAEMVLQSGDLICDYGSSGHARVANQDPEAAETER